MPTNVIGVERLYNLLGFKILKQIGFPTIAEYENVTDNLVPWAVSNDTAHLFDVLHHIRIAVAVKYGNIVVLAVLQSHFVAVRFNAAHAVKIRKVYYVFKVISPHQQLTHGRGGS